MASLMNVLAIVGLSSPLQNLQVNTQDSDATFVTAIDGQSLTRLLGQLL